MLDPSCGTFLSSEQFITVDLQANSARVVRQLKAMAAAGSAAAGFNRPLWNKQLAPLLKLWEQLMSANPGLRQSVRQPSGVENCGPVEAFVSLERTNANYLILHIDTSINKLSRVLRGADGLSPVVQSVGMALMREEVPASWESLWDGLENPMAYCREVVLRAAAIEQWLVKSQNRQLLTGGSLNLSELFNPITFLNALRQQSARQLSTSVR